MLRISHWRYTLLCSVTALPDFLPTFFAPSYSFVALGTLIEATTVIQVPCDDIFMYKPFSLGVFKAEYDQVRLYIWIHNS